MATRSALSKFSSEELCKFLLDKILLIGEDTIMKFREQRVDGSVFLDLNTEDLKELTSTLGERKAIEKLLKQYEPLSVSDILLYYLKHLTASN